MSEAELLDWGNMLVGSAMNTPLVFWRLPGLKEWYPRLGIGLDPGKTLDDLDALEARATNFYGMADDHMGR